MVLLIFIQIISRALIGTSFSWTEEVARFLMIWITFLGAGFAFQYGAHIGIEFFVQKMPPYLAKVCQLIAALACAIFFILIIMKGIELINRAMLQTSPALKIPMGYVYLIFPVSGGLMLLNLIDVTLKAILAPKSSLKGDGI